MNNFKLRGIIIAVVMIAGLILSLPTMVSLLTPYQLADNWLGPLGKHIKQVKLGLDLQGGMHLILKVDTDKAVTGKLNIIASTVKSEMQQKRIHYTKIEVVAPDSIAVTLRDPADQDKLTAILNEQTSFADPSTETIGGVTVFRYSVKRDEIQKIKDSSISQALETIRNRIDQLGVSEPSIITEGKDRINVQLPGITDPERAKRIIGETAVLEFKLVDEDHSLSNALAGDIPQDSYIAYMKETNEPILLKKQVELTGDTLNDARVKIDRASPYISLDFNAQGARDFERITGENINKRLAILLDKKVYSAPVIKDRIAGGKASITGRFTDQEAKNLAIVLRSGSLLAPVEILEERTVGPSLGKDSIHQGLVACAIGGVLVIIFMIIYYRASGMLANIAVILNIMLIAAFMSLVGAVLTLPGIAGIVLTIGMAVDANILIFERMREEIRLGRTPKMVVEAGYKHAISTVVDANVTTLIAGLVLFQFGTGPIKGFAVTLCVGILTTLFTVLVGCKWVMEWFVNSKNVSRISI
ncbi:MAG TPA: protein translocase subunit SecD [Desulfomonilia bacterium]